MAPRVNQDDVRSLVQTKAGVDVQAYIDIAVALTDKVASNDFFSLLSTALLKQIEANLAAHYYSLRDPSYLAKNTGDAGATFYGQTGMGLDFTPWGQTAKELDLTGFLNSLGKGRAASVTWLGKAPSDQTDFRDRD